MSWWLGLDCWKQKKKDVNGDVEVEVEEWVKLKFFKR